MPDFCHTAAAPDPIAATRHWLETAVIGLNLCPFAKAPYRKNRVRFVHSRARHLDDFLERLDAELQYLLTTPAEVCETTLLVETGLFGDFDEFNSMLDWADSAVIDNGAEGILQIAPFHPQFVFGDEAAGDITHYTNRSPYPTLHLIRESSIDRAVAAFPDAAHIFERNKALLREMGHDGWRKLGIAYPAAAAKANPTASGSLNDSANALCDECGESAHAPKRHETTS